MELAFLCLAIILVREYSFYRERTANAKERQILLQRIQAPTTAVAAFVAEESGESVSGLPVFTDEEQWEVVNGG